MTLSLADFVELLTDNGEEMMLSSARLAHVGDSASILLPASQRMSRYTIQPQGSALVAAKTTLQGITAVSGLPAQLAAAQTALQATDLISITAVRQASDALLAATPATIAGLVQAYVAAIRLAAPSDAITILLCIANYVPWSASPYVTMLYGSILCELANAILDFTPRTSNESLAILDQYVSLFDATIGPASDLGWSSTTDNLARLRSAVLAYLQNLIAVEPATQSYTFNDSLPDVCVAYALYGDASRAEELVAANDPANPLYMPSTISYRTT